MANAKHLELLRQGVGVWNAWRLKDLSETPDLSHADLCKANLSRANLNHADLTDADLRGANLTHAEARGADLRHADLRGADLTHADLEEAYLSESNLRGVNFAHAFLREVKLSGAELGEANLIEADLIRADLRHADLTGADLTGADLTRADLSSAILNKANLKNAVLDSATLVETQLIDADLSGCNIYGISAWRLSLSQGTKQQNLVITERDEPEVTTDDIEVAQFIYLLLHNDRIRQVIDTITSKVVLILGRFTPERKLVLDALREELRKRGYVPVVFDFEKSQGQTIVETVTLLARMARFVIADLSDAKSVLQELQLIVASYAMLPVQPLIIAAQQEPGMFDVIERFPSVLKTYRCDDLAQLIADFDTLMVACRLKSWSLQHHGHEAAQPNVSGS